MARSFIRFDGLPSPTENKNVTKATLGLYNHASTCMATPRTLYVGAPLKPFSESTLTWSNQLDSSGKLFDPSGGLDTPAPALGTSAPCDGKLINFDITALAWRWLQSGSPFSAPNTGVAIIDAAEGQGTAGWRLFQSSEAAANQPTLTITYGTGAPPDMTIPAATAIPDGAVVATTTPTLSVTAETDPNNEPVSYWFRATPSPDAESGAKVVDSGWLTAAELGGCPSGTCSYTVPPGVLADGGTYSWHVYTSDKALPAVAPDWVRTFTVELHQGGAGPMPADPAGPVQVNVASGNLVFGSSSPTFAAVGGPMGLTYTYNSAAPAAGVGLVGSYYADPTQTRSFANLSPTVVRVDHAVDFWWNDAPPVPTMGHNDYLVRWEGTIKVPTTGTYRFGAGSDDGARIRINNQLVVDSWHIEQSWPTATYSGPIAMTAGVPVSIVVEYFQGPGMAYMQLMAKGPFGAGGADTEAIVPASWLSHTVSPLSQGWTLAPAGVAYASARLSDRALTFTDPSGSALTYPWSGAGAGFVPPSSEDGVAAADANGGLSLHAPDGRTYVFDAWGALTSAPAPTDDGQSTALTYGWSTGAGAHRLVSITDPYTTRSVTLRYGGRDTCPSAPPLFDTTTPTDMLCQVAWPDATTTDLFYEEGRLARIVEPGGATTDFGYDAAAKLRSVRTPLQADALGATAITGVDDDDTSRTAVAYDGSGRVHTVTLATPTAGADPPKNTYDYTVPAGDYTAPTAVKVDVEGITPQPPNDFARRFAWTPDPDPVVSTKVGTVWTYSRPTAAPAARSVTATDALGVDGTATGDWGERPTIGTDGADRMSTAVYDATMGSQLTGMPTDAFGAGPSSCFDATTHKPTTSCAPTIAQTVLSWDGKETAAWTGLAGTWWTNATLSGQPRAHARRDAPNLAASPPAGISGSYSARFSGEIHLGGATNLSLRLAGYGRLYVDDVLVVDAWSQHTTAVVVTGSTTTSAGRHRIRVDYASFNATTPEVAIWSGNWGAVASSILAPRYGDLTSVKTIDGAVTRRVDTEYLTEATGLPKTVSQDPAGLNLQTTMTYDALGRLATRALPADATATTAYAYYGATEAPITGSGCAQAAASQAGALKRVTGPDPDGGGPQTATVIEFVHDAVGRVVGSQVVGGGGWSCTEYDGRGRPTSQTFPAWDGQAARTVTSNYAVGADPLVVSVSDGLATPTSGTITTTLDMLGRVRTYRDVWDQVTDYTYDRAGRLVTVRSPQGRLDTDYDAASKPTVQYWDDNRNATVAGPAMATATYDAAGELAWVDYGNGTHLGSSTAPIGRDAAGRTTLLTWTGPTATVLGTDEVRYSPAGRVVDQKVDGTDANPGSGFGAADSANFVYDAAGRLTTGWVSDALGAAHRYEYDYTSVVAGCTLAPNAGRNTNRSVAKLDGNPTATYCYDRADRLVSSTDTAVGVPTYDARGNTKTIGAQTHTWDGADRHMATAVTAGTTVSYRRDATGRIVERTEGTSVTRYGHTGPGDASAFTLTTGTPMQVIDRHNSLVGGVSVTKTATSQGWHYPNIHGDILVSADGAGAKVDNNRRYEPFGTALAGIPETSSGNMDDGWLGQPRRPTEHAAGIATIEMGARPYVPGIGRFLSVDPVEGGSANDYEYCSGDPVNCFDPTGLSHKGRTVYVVRDRSTNQVVYVGRTNNYERRAREHHSSRFPRDQYEVQPYAEQLTYEQQRGLEQYLYNLYCNDGPLLNQIAPIAESNKRAGEYVRAAQEWLARNKFRTIQIKPGHCGTGGNVELAPPPVPLPG